MATTVHELLYQAFRDSAQEYAERPAVVLAERVVTYRDLREGVEQLAAHLCDRIPDAGLPVACVVDHGLESLTALFSLWAAGQIAVPLPPEASEGRLESLLEHSTARFVIAGAATGERLAPLASADRVLIPIDAGFGPVPANPPTAEDRASGDAPAIILYTSGSTSRPKGVVLSHRSLLFNNQVNTETLQLRPTDRALLSARYDTISGVSDAFRMLLVGGALIPVDLDSDGLQGIVTALETHRPTILHFVPTIFRRLVARFGEACRFEAVRILHLGGEPVTRQDFDLFRRHFPQDCVLVANLGCTEVPSFRRTYLTRDTPWSGTTVPLNGDVPGKRVSVVPDPKAGNGASKAVGEIVVQSRFTADGYWRDPEATRRSFHVCDNGETTYHTGDLGRLHADGTLEYLGRKDLQIKRLGRKVDLLEIEAFVAGHAHVHEASVVAVERGRSLVLVAFAAGSSRLDRESLRDFCREHLASHQQLEIVTIDELSTLPGGKIDRQSLSRLARSHLDLQDNLADPPRSDAERRLQAIWRTILETDSVGRSTDFFQSGGDSLGVTDCLLQVEREFSKRISPAVLYENSTLERFARAIEAVIPKSRSTYFGNIREASGDVRILSVGMAPFHAALGHLPETYSLATLKIDGFEAETFRQLSISDTVDLYLQDLDSEGYPTPTAIVGYSYGGLLAFALAERLRSRGRGVPLVMLLEPSTLIPYGIVGELWNRFRESVYHLRNERQTDFNSSDLRARYESGEAMNSRERWHLIRPTIRRNRRNYRPRGYEGDVILVGSPEYLTLHRGWQGLIDGRLETVALPHLKNHLSVLESPHAALWVDYLQTKIEQQPLAARSA